MAFSMMSATLPARAPISVRKGRVVTVFAQSNRVDRRTALKSLLVPALFAAAGAKSAFAETGQASQGAEQVGAAIDSARGNKSDDRKAALRETAAEIKSTGRDKEAFPESGYSVGQTRQEEGMKHIE